MPRVDFRLPSCLLALALGVLLSPSLVLAEEEASPPSVATDDGGPNVSDPTKKPIVAPGPATPPPVERDPNEEIDLEKEPWLVESARSGVTLRGPKMLWANSFLWAEAPKVEVEEWITDKPDMEGKYVLVEVWATWCPPCRRSLKLLNYYHEKYGDELCVISICETDREALEEMKGDTKLEDVKFHLAVDTKRRFANALGVFGIPHAVLIEPQYGCVIWEGMPTLPGHELRGDIIEKVLEIGRKLKAKEAEQAKAGGETETK